MALRKFGRIWYIYYRDLGQKLRSLSTAETDRKKAKPKEVVFMAQLAAEKKRARRSSGRMVQHKTINEIPAMIDARTKRNRLKISDALDVYTKYYGPPALATKKYFNRFAKCVSIKFMDELNGFGAFGYLEEMYGDVSGRSFNEAKCSLNVVYKRLLIQAGMEQSPFAAIANRPHDKIHWRSFSDSEIQQLLKVANPGQHAAITITNYTGLRKSSVYALRWDEIRSDEEHLGAYIRHLPPKTARFGRYIEIPLHDELVAYLKKIPRVNDYILGFAEQMRSGASYYEQWGNLYEEAGIFSDERGIASYGSLRKRFIERCDAANMRRTATRGVVGHVSDEITDTYSSDFQGALPIKTFVIPS